MLHEGMRQTVLANWFVESCKAEFLLGRVSAAQGLNDDLHGTRGGYIFKGTGQSG